MKCSVNLYIMVDNPNTRADNDDAHLVAKISEKHERCAIILKDKTQRHRKEEERLQKHLFTSC